jgi:hypothetical protein
MFLNTNINPEIGTLPKYENSKFICYYGKSYPLSKGLKISDIQLLFFL